MPALSFSGKTTLGEFWDLILRRVKIQTCREPRKRPIKAGDKLRLYWKQRVPEDRKRVHLIAEARSVGVKRMRYEEFAFDEGFARRDGFGSSLELQDWFGCPYEYSDEEYDVIHWRDLTVIKGTKAFKIIKDRYLKLFFDSSKEDLIPKGQHIDSTDDKEKILGFSSKLIQQTKLPMPFDCFSLFIHPCTEKGKVTGVIWFCDRVGCICSPCREDMTSPKESYPIYCPPVEGFEMLEGYCDCGSSTCDICNPFWSEDPEAWEENPFEFS